MSPKSMGICSVALSLTITTSAHAHKPIFSEGAGGNINVAIAIDDVNISYVVYHEITADVPQLWLTFEANAGQPLFFQLGVPVIERLQDYRPALAVLGPGLPQADLPFTIPDELGAVILTPDMDTEVEFFHEPITGTDSWILGTLEIDAPQQGLYYAVAYVPNSDTGKLWVAPGTVEQFGLEDIISLTDTINRVRAFHEVSAVTLPCCVPLLAAGVLLIGGVKIIKHKKRPSITAQPQ